MWSAKAAESVRVKSWEIIADNLKKAGWSYGYVSAVDREGRTIWIADANRGDGKRFVVRADEILTAFLELERAVWPSRKRALTGLVAARWAALLLRVPKTPLSIEYRREVFHVEKHVFAAIPVAQLKEEQKFSLLPSRQQHARRG